MLRSAAFTWSCACLVPSTRQLGADFETHMASCVFFVRIRLCRVGTAAWIGCTSTSYGQRLGVSMIDERTRTFPE
jgi:hypothetical protein